MKFSFSFFAKRHIDIILNLDVKLKLLHEILKVSVNWKLWYRVVNKLLW